LAGDLGSESSRSDQGSIVRTPRCGQVRRHTAWWPPTSAHAVYVGLGGLACLAALAYALHERYPVGRPCPSGTRSEHPISVSLVPGVLRHQSWIHVSSERIVPGMRFLACRDGLVVGEGVVEDDHLQTGVMKVGIPTHWVNWMWITGRLSSCRDPNHWMVVSSELWTQR
jgi:hypothetical protein